MIEPGTEIWAFLNTIRRRSRTAFVMLVWRQNYFFLKIKKTYQRWYFAENHKTNRASLKWVKQFKTKIWQNIWGLSATFFSKTMYRGYLWDTEVGWRKAIGPFRTHPIAVAATQGQVQTRESCLCASDLDRIVPVPVPPGSAVRRLGGFGARWLAAETVSYIAPSQYLRRCCCYWYLTPYYLYLHDWLLILAPGNLLV